MKSKIVALCLALSLATLTGCTSGGGVPFLETPYQAGRTFVFVDTLTESFQPVEVSAAINQVYVLAGTNASMEGFVDIVVNIQINELFPDVTPASRQLIFNVYKALYNRLSYQIEQNPGTPAVETVDEFFRGVRDALEIYQPTR